MRRCIECGACERACPILNKKTVVSEKTEGYIIRIKDNKILYESTSGGAFTALADYILEQNGIVYGAGYDNNMRRKMVLWFAIVQNHILGGLNFTSWLNIIQLIRL